MNPMTNIKNVLKLSEQELRLNSKSSWHDQYKNSAWIFVGGLPYDLTEGDIICVFSQYGEIVNLNLVRDKGTGKSKGFCFICFEDQRSTNLAVDNFNGIKLLNRTIRVDHCEDYKAPKDDKMDEEVRQLHAEGCAPGSKFGNMPKLPSSASASNGGLDQGHVQGPLLPPMENLLKVKHETEDSPKKQKKKEKKDRKERKEKKTKDDIRKIFKKKKKGTVSSSSSSSSSEDSSSDSDESRSERKKSQKKLKKKKQESSSSSESEAERKKKRGKTSQRSSSSSSESEEEKRPSSKKDLDEGKARKRLKEGKPSHAPDLRNVAKPDLPPTRDRDGGYRSRDVSFKDESKDRSFSFKGHKDAEKSRGEHEWSTKDRRDKSRDDTRRSEGERKNREDRRNEGRDDDRSRKYPHVRFREERRDTENYKRKERGGY